MLRGTNFTLLIGRTLPAPAPVWLMNTIESVQVSTTDDGASGFDMTFEAGRSGGLAGALDFQHFTRSTLRPFSRVVMIVTIRAIPKVIFDGVITNIQSAPSSEPGATKIKVTGEDLSFFMDRVEVSKTHNLLPDFGMVATILSKYSYLGILPAVFPPLNSSPASIKRPPVQKGTDLKFLRELAKKHNNVFYITPGPLPLTATAYWGPATRTGIPQRALTQNMGPMTNLNSISFQNKAEQPSVVVARVQDSDFNQVLPVITFAPTRIPLAPISSLLSAFPYMKREKIENSNGDRYNDARSKAQAKTNSSTEDSVTATGELDVSTYGSILQARKLVGVRGVGFTNDGLYYVKQVTHNIKIGSYTQSFTLTRDGTGSFLPVLPV
ncbi:MAG: hypothetical protein NXI24_17150 [bacterium]|nr:hypothetical protein [bacterium]